METISFKNMLGHQLVMDYLRNSLIHGPVAHAFLFYGPEGIGKTTIATRFAQALMCPEASKSGDACDICDSCRRFINNAHPNFQLLEPEGKTGYKIEQLREMRKDVAMMGSRDSRRVYLIPQADLMKPQAANAILKTLEEPPPGVVLILITSQILRILPTIVSRCQQVRFGRLSLEETGSLLQTKTGLDKQSAELLAMFGDKSPGQCLYQADPAIASLRLSILNILSDFKPKESRKVLMIPLAILDRKKVADKEGPKIDITVIYDWLMFWFRDLIVYRLTEDPDQLVHRDAAEQVSNIAKYWSWGSARAAIQQLEYIKFLASKNLSAQICLESVLYEAFRASGTS